MNGGMGFLRKLLGIDASQTVIDTLDVLRKEYGDSTAHKMIDYALVFASAQVAHPREHFRSNAIDEYLAGREDLEQRERELFASGAGGIGYLMALIRHGLVSNFTVDGGYWAHTMDRTTARVLSGHARELKSQSLPLEIITQASAIPTGYSKK